MTRLWSFVVAAGIVAAATGEASAQEVFVRVGPDVILKGEQVTVFADFVNFAPAATLTATADATALGGPAALPLAGAGTVKSASFTTSATLTPGTYAVPVEWTSTDPAAPSGDVPATNVSVIEKARCVPPGYGVPYLGGPPRWTGWVGDTRPILDVTDDPRWNGATAAGGAWNHGAATEPVNFRAVRSGAFVYLQWVVNVSADNERRVLYVGFRDHGNAFIVRFNGREPAPLSPTSAVDPAWCTQSFDLCEPNNTYKVFVADPDHSMGTCGTLTNETLFVQHSVGGTLSDVPWIAETARYYTLDANSWAIQLRVPVSPTTTSFNDGLTENFAMWFEARPEVAGFDASYAWPQAMTNYETCESSGASFVPTLVHASVADSSTMAPIRMLDRVGAAQCTLGLRLRYSEVGVVQTITPPATADDVLLTSQFVAPTLGGSIDNILIARPENPTSATIPASSLTATFRLARWGVQPTVDTQWQPIPGGTGVALNEDIGPSGDKGRFQFTWPLTPADAATFSGSNRHQCMLVEMKVTGPDAGGAHIDLENVSVYRNMDFGTMSVFPQPAVIDVRGLPTYPGQKEHEIYLVVVPRGLPATLPNGSTGLSWLQQRARSAAERVRMPYAQALELDPDLPQKSGGLPEDAKRMEVDESWRTPYAEGGDGVQRGDRLREHCAGQDDPVVALLPARERALHDILGGAANAPAVKGDAPAEALTMELADALPPAELARVVPTLQVYAFYRTGEKVGEDGRALLRPMTSFSFFLSHEGPISGTKWVIDGVEPVNPTDPDNNVFRVRIPIDKPGRNIRLRVEALESAATIFPKQNYPCSCCSKGNCPAAYRISNAGLTALALLFAMRRRKPRRIGI